VSDDRYRLSFDHVAETYERARPGYAPEALAWLAERIGIGPGRRVLDLAAGTGKLTRQLLALGADVAAVEPGHEMRAVLERVVPQAEALAGTAEAIPLPDESVDAVTVAQAFHWFRTEPALAEIHRVLRPGGALGLLWNEWDDNDPIQRAVDVLLSALRPARKKEGQPAWAVALDASPQFGPLDERAFRHSFTLDADRLVEWVASTSAVAAAHAAVQERVEAQVRELAGHGPLELTISTLVFATDRVEV
jgi:ubiquinone/menaquinone biosynthesis C-methylase UbiE